MRGLTASPGDDNDVVLLGPVYHSAQLGCWSAPLAGGNSDGAFELYTVTFDAQSECEAERDRIGLLLTLADGFRAAIAFDDLEIFFRAAAARFPCDESRRTRDAVLAAMSGAA